MSARILKFTMKPFLYICIAVLAFPVPAEAGLDVFACEPEWGALARELGGEQVRVFIATTAFQDPHRIEARPSLIAKMRRADLVVCSGAELEAGWLPLLLRRSANSKVQPGTPGFFEAAMQVERLDISATADRSLGDVHSQGNPHVHLDPRRLAKIAGVLAARLVQIDKANATQYQERKQQFENRWKHAIQTWQTRAAPLKGIKVVVHHKDWVYLLDWLGMEEVAALEARPGIPPSSGHLAQLLRQLKTAPAKMILYTRYQNGKAADWLSERTGIPAVQLPFTVGGSDRAQDLEGLIDHTLDLLLEAAR